MQIKKGKLPAQPSRMNSCTDCNSSAFGLARITEWTSRTISLPPPGRT